MTAGSSFRFLVDKREFGNRDEINRARDSIATEITEKASPEQIDVPKRTEAGGLTGVAPE